MRGGPGGRGDVQSTPRSAWVRRSQALVGVAIVTGLTVFAPPTADAHSPHDVVFDVELSPEFAQDHTAYAIVRDYLLRSVDGGDTWVRLVRGLDNQRQLSALEVSPTDKRVLYVGSRGDGVYRSIDGGRTWAQPPGRLPGLNVLALTLSPHSSDALVATIQRPEGPVMARTDDGGQSWRTIDGLPKPSAVAFAPDDPQLLLGGSTDGRVSRSRDGGASWEETFRADRAGAVTTIAFAPPGDRPTPVFVGTRDGGLWRSDDLAQTFTRQDARTTGDEIQSVAFSPTFSTDRTMWLSTWSTGAFRSEDGGESWAPFGDGLTTNEQADLLDEPSFGQLRESSGYLFLASFDGLFRSTGPAGWEELETTSSTNIASIAISPAYGVDRTIAVATYLNGALLSEDGGSTWTPMNDGLSEEITWQHSEDYFARLFSISFSPAFALDRTLFTSERGFVLRTQAPAGPWNATTPDGLLVAEEEPPDYALWAFSPGYEDDGTVLLGTNRGKVFRSTDGGTEFEKVAQLDAPISAIVASPSFGSDATIFAGTTTGLRRSHDQGATWETVGALESLVTSLAISPDFAADHQIYAGTSAGLFVSTDGGGTWEPAAEDRFGPESYIEAIAISPAVVTDRTILVSVRGRGLFRSVDGGRSFAPVAEQLFADGYVLGNFYQDTSEPIVFSPDFERDRTIYGFAETTLLKSVDGGDTWTPIALPRTTHPADVPPGVAPLLSRPKHSAPREQHTSDRSIDIPIGRLSPVRVVVALLVAVTAFAVLSLSRRGRFAERVFESVWVRLAGALVVLGVGLVVVAA